MKILFFALVLTSKAFAWGPTGHRAVGMVAEKFLSGSASNKIYKILDGQTLARVATWPDEIKSDPQTYSHTYNWHYTDWPNEMQSHDETNSSGKLITSINEQLKVLKNPLSPKDKKVFALKFLTHLVGDLHMPLHVGNGLDQGGNYCKVFFHNKLTNLHALWDEGMIDFTRLSFMELANFIGQKRTEAQIAAWKKGGLLDWAEESKVLREQLYPPETGKYCKKDAAEADLPKLAYDYSYKFMPVVEDRLFQAGIRLATLLNLYLK